MCENINLTSFSVKKTQKKKINAPPFALISWTTKWGKLKFSVFTISGKLKIVILSGDQLKFTPMRKYNQRTSWNMQSSMQYDWADPDGSFVLAPEGKAEGKWCKIEPLRSLLTVVPLDETTMHRFPAGLANTYLEIKTTFANIKPLKKSCLTTCFVFFFFGGGQKIN